MAFENYTVRQYINARFAGDRTVMSDEEYNIVHTEFIDAAGLYETEEFGDVSYIYFLNNRINTINIGIRLHREFLVDFKFPYIEQLNRFEKYGHRLYWNNNEEDFLKQLDRIENREKKYVSQLENCIKLLKDKRQKKINKETVSKKDFRGDFIMMLNSLGKNGYKIDKDKETVEDIAYMVKQQTEEYKQK